MQYYEFDQIPARSVQRALAGGLSCTYTYSNVHTRAYTYIHTHGYTCIYGCAGAERLARGLSHGLIACLRQVVAFAPKVIKMRRLQRRTREGRRYGRMGGRRERARGEGQGGGIGLALL